MIHSLQVKLVDWLLRGGVAFALLFPALHAFFHPHAWIGYFPPFLHSIAQSAGLSDTLLLHLLGVFEAALALWILSGWRILYPSLVTAGFLVAIVMFNRPEFPVLFRDLPIAGAAVALALLHWYDRAEISG